MWCQFWSKVQKMAKKAKFNQILTEKGKMVQINRTGRMSQIVTSQRPIKTLMKTVRRSKAKCTSTNILSRFVLEMGAITNHRATLRLISQKLSKSNRLKVITIKAGERKERSPLGDFQWRMEVECLREKWPENLDQNLVRVNLSGLAQGKLYLEVRQEGQEVKQDKDLVQHQIVTELGGFQQART